MASLTSFLPKPLHSRWTEDDDNDEDGDGGASALAAQRSASKAPPYGKRQGWVPRSAADFGDGGAFPEIHVAQFPLSMGQQSKGSVGSSGGEIVPVTLDADGKVKYDALIRQGSAADRTIHSTYKDLVPVDITRDDPLREMPQQEDIDAATEKTKAALGQLVAGKVAAAQSSKIQSQSVEPTYIRYTPAQQGIDFNSGASQRIIRMVEVQQDPLEPPKFKTNKKLPRGPPSPPAPVLHSPPRKVTVQEQADWKIPPALSSWKNHRGYTIPLDKRLAADGRGLQDAAINDGFAKFSEALYQAERASREAIELRAQIQKRALSREKERKEDTLRALAQRARDERAGLRPAAEEEEDVAEREEIREDRRRERERQRRIQAAAPDKRSRLARDEDRDISEKIALGLPATGAKMDAGFDARLFNQSHGLASGFKDDEAYDVYDKPMRGERASSVYRPSKQAEEFTEDDVEKLKSLDRFRADKGFQGTDGPAAPRSGPVQFERAQPDMFGLDKLFADAKRGGGDDDRGDAKRRRRE